MHHGHHPDLEVRPISPPLRRTQAIVMRNDRTLTAPLRAVVDAVTEQGERTSRRDLTATAFTEAPWCVQILSTYRPVSWP